MHKRFSAGTTLIWLGLALLSGCATLPSPEQMKAEVADYQLPKKPDADKALVYVVRPSGLGGLIRFNVFLNDQEAGSEMGYTRASEYIHFHVPAGSHRIFSKAENWAEIQVSARAGDIMFIRQDPTLGIIMARNNIVLVEDYEGKYHVKTLKLGTILKTDK